MKRKRRPHGDADTAKNQTKSFPKESHSLVSTISEYLKSHLSVSKIYDLYKEKYINDNIEPVKKIHVLPYIFHRIQCWFSRSEER